MLDREGIIKHLTFWKGDYQKRVKMVSMDIDTEQRIGGNRAYIIGYMEGKKMMYEEMVFRFQSILDVIDQKEQGVNKPKLYPGMGTKTLGGTFTGD